jgi:VanZ family protein
MSPTQRTLIRSVAPIAVMGLIFYLSAQPDLDSGLGTWDTIGRKLAHVGVYTGLTLSLFWALRPSIAQPLPLAVAFTLIYAVSDEFHQGFVEGRDGRPIDVAIDAIGIGIAWLFLRYDHRVRSQPLEDQE